MALPIEQNLRLLNDSKPAGDGWWEWSVWVDGLREELDQIEWVRYRLHPTFPQPLQVVRDRSSAFKLHGAGWGEFAVAAEVAFKGGGSARLERWLELSDAAGKRSAEPGTAAGRRPTVFLSHSLADAPLADALHAELEQQGIEAWSAERAAEAGANLYSSIHHHLKSADVVVPLISNPLAAFVLEEAQAAQAAGRLVLPVVIGGAVLPAALQGLARLELRETKNVSGLADAIAARVKDLATPEE